MTPAQIESTTSAFRDWLQHRDPTRLQHLGAHGRWEHSATPVFDLGYVCRVTPPQAKARDQSEVTTFPEVLRQPEVIRQSDAVLARHP